MTSDLKYVRHDGPFKITGTVKLQALSLINKYTKHKITGKCGSAETTLLEFRTNDYPSQVEWVTDFRLVHYGELS